MPEYGCWDHSPTFCRHQGLIKVNRTVLGRHLISEAIRALDVNEGHLASVLETYVEHYDTERPHGAVG
jgi:hypothetical protein